MRIITCLTAAAIAAGLTGCYTYPVYQPVPVARLTPAQSAALAQQQQPLTQAQRDQLAHDNAQVQQDQNAYAAAAPQTYVYPAAPVYYDAPYYGGYPYAYGYGGGFYPWYPGVSLSLGFGGYYRGGYGGYRGGYGGYHGGGGFHHH